MVEDMTEDVLNRVKSCLQSLEVSGGRGKRKEDTKSVKKSLAKLGQDLKYKVGTNRLDKDFAEENKFNNREWLFDLTWYLETNRHYEITDLILAMECEWGGQRVNAHDDRDEYGEVKYDFQKLIVSVSKIKLMIFHERKEGDFANLIKDYFQPEIDRFNCAPLDSVFLCVAYNDLNKCKIECLRKRQ